MERKIRNTQLFLFDMDGTLYLGNTLFDFTKELLNTINQSGKRYMFITNNSSKSVTDYINKLDKLGIKSTYEDFLTSSQATAYYLNENYPNAVLYVCGTESLKQELKSNGYKISEDLDEITCVVIGNDTELAFKKLDDLSRILLAKKDIPYIATNPDLVCPTEFGCVPDCGSFCDMLYNVCKRMPVYIGKPSPLMIQLAIEKANVKPENTAVVGDRIYTDIKSGINANALSILVLSGETDEKILNESDIKPDIVLDDASYITKILIGE